MALLPTIYGFRDHVDAGGLISYGMRVARTPEANRTEYDGCGGAMGTRPTIIAGVGQFAVIQSVAPSLGVELRAINVRDATKIERGIASIRSPAEWRHDRYSKRTGHHSS
jgi:hypothetical protein